MDVAFTAGEIAFREEVCRFLDEAFDDELKDKLAGVEVSPYLKEAMVEWQNRLNQKGWLAPGWPVEYGGQDWTITQHFIFRVTEYFLCGNVKTLNNTPIIYCNNRISSIVEN